MDIIQNRVIRYNVYLSIMKLIEGVQYLPGQHNGKFVIWLQCPYDSLLIKEIKKLTGSKWSQQQRCWYIPDTVQNRQQFGLAPVPTMVSANLGTENKAALEQFIQQLTLKAYSKSTIRTYRTELIQLLTTLKTTPVNTLTANRLKDYFYWCFTTLKLSEHTIHSRLNAVKFYFEQVLGRDNFFWEVPRPKKPLQLPTVFSKEDIENLLKAVDNSKHKTMLLLTYAGGLRLGEVIQLQKNQIDSKRMVIHIKQAKGKKDRVIPLSKTALAFLRNYYKTYKPGQYLFEGQYEGEHYSARSLQLIFERAKQKAGILKKGGIHALRHSYATHLLYKGVDITYIQQLLGHNDLKTTLRYLHVTIRDLQNIVSPIGDLAL